MTLAAGTELGPYEIVAPVGAGGMGEVYRTHDTRLGRDVAVKVIPEELAVHEDRLRRFEQEARATAALSHPNILAVFDVGVEGEVHYIVEELLEGQTLAERLRKGPLSLREAIETAVQVARGLAAAHAKTIAHRDLKPANVFLTTDGRVKILDFGLARWEGLGPEEATASAVTDPGTRLGTVGYMSPEQVRGGRGDHRSDIFSLGVVLYEMLAGRRAFARESAVETLNAILNEEPPELSGLRTTIPVAVDRLIRRCLEKRPEVRFQSAHDVALALEVASATGGGLAAVPTNMLDMKVEPQEVKEEPDSQATAPGGVAAAKRRYRRRWVALVAVGVVVLAAVTTVTLWRLHRSELPAPRLVQLTWTPQAGSGSFSPDGSQFAFASTGDRGDNWDIWLKIVGEAEARRLTTDSATDKDPAWSPDGKQIAFVRFAPGASAGMVHIVSPLGGPERRLSDFPTRHQLSWSADGRWLAAAHAREEDEVPPESRGIHLIPSGGGQSRPLTLPKAHTWDTDPGFSADGRALAYASCEGPRGMPACDVYVQPLDGDASPRGAARRLTRQGFACAGLAWARDGRSILYSSAAGPNSHLWRVRADGSAPPERLELAGAGAYRPSTVSSRDRLLFTRARVDQHIWRLKVGATATPFIESSFRDFNPQYSADGRRVAFESDRADERWDIWLADAEGTNLTRLTRGPGRAQGSARWSPDGRTIVFDSQGEDGRFDIWTIGVDGSGLRQVTRDPADENMPSWSRDGRFLYYGSNRTGRYEIWRVPVAGGPEEQVTREGGFLPFESLDGRTLYYKRSEHDSQLLARPTAGGEERTLAPCVPNWAYAVGPRGVFHVDCTTGEGPAASRQLLRHWDAATGRDREVAVLGFGEFLIHGLSNSPDGTSLLYQYGTSSSDLMMIENFR